MKKETMPKINKTLGIIPARFASSRFPGKPLAVIGGKSMIQRVYEQANKASMMDDVLVATDDERIFQHVRAFGGKVVMTSSAHPSGTDRCAEVAGFPGMEHFDFIVNVQGDEPFIQPAQIDLLVGFLQKTEFASIVTLAKEINRAEDLTNPNVVKVVFDRFFKALYFSRSAIPFMRNQPLGNWVRHRIFYKHIGMYAFRRDTLLEVTKLAPSRLETAESLEQLRWLENGFPIGVCLTELDTTGIDTPQDLENCLKVV